MPALYSSSEVWKRVKKQGDLEAAALSPVPSTPFCSSFSSGVAFGIPQGKSTNGQIISGEAQHSWRTQGEGGEEDQWQGLEEQTLLIHIAPSLGEGLQKSSQSLRFCGENSETENLDIDLAVWVGQTMSELLKVIHLDPTKGNFKVEAGQILLQVWKSCTDVFNKG